MTLEGEYIGHILLKIMEQYSGMIPETEVSDQTHSHTTSIRDTQRHVRQNPSRKLRSEKMQLLVFGTPPSHERKARRVRQGEPQRD
ncbi:hypothetical protein BASA_1587 [Bifidobacterium animalis subsp. animalis]|nr:hypothetical protein BASA_1587 [Bifidobacterium animalis subsp. animalis]